LVSYFIFASVIATSLSALLVGLTKLKGLPLRTQTRLTGLRLTLHASALALGSGGPWLSNVLILGTTIGAATVLARTVRVPGALATLAVTASVVDIVSFTTGPTRWLLSSDSAAVASALLYLAVPQRGVPHRFRSSGSAISYCSGPSTSA
jgi:hypothetical protein